MNVIQNAVDALVIKYRSTRDEEVFNQLYGLVKKKLERVSSGVYGNSQDVEDCYQQCCVALLRAIDSWDPIEAAAVGRNFSSYLGSALLNERTYYYGSVKYGIPTQNNGRVNYTTRDYSKKDFSYVSRKINLDQVVGDEENSGDGVTFLDMIEDRRHLSVEDQLFLRQFKNQLIEFASEGRERYVIQLMVNEYLSVSEVAKRVNITDSLVRSTIKAFQEKAKDYFNEQYMKDLKQIFAKPRGVFLNEGVVTTI